MQSGDKGDYVRSDLWGTCGFLIGKTLKRPGKTIDGNIGEAGTSISGVGGGNPNLFRKLRLGKKPPTEKEDLPGPWVKGSQRNARKIRILIITARGE